SDIEPCCAVASHRLSFNSPLSDPVNQSQRTRERGSRRPRSQSPSRLTEKTRRNRQAPGKATTHHARSTYCRPTLMIDPQLGAGGWIPSPRDDKPGSNKIIQPTHTL